MNKERRTQLLEELKRDCKRATIEIGKGLNPSETDETLNYFDGLDTYRELAEAGQLPPKLKILRNLAVPPHRERIYGDISDDPVYQFLLETRKSLDSDLLEILYTQDFPERETRLNTGKFKDSVQEYDDMTNRELYFSGKREFIRDLIDSIQRRGGSKPLTSEDEFDKSAKVSSLRRYQVLETLADSEDREDAIRMLVADAPVHPWESFAWGEYEEAPHTIPISPNTKQAERIVNDNLVEIPF